MSKAVVYVHGKGGSVAEAEHYSVLFPDDQIIGFDYVSQTPWDAKIEFQDFLEHVRKKHSSVILIANSIGAYFSMQAFSAKEIERAFFISPIVDMEDLITNMIKLAGVTEKQLYINQLIPTTFGEVLSWEYLSYVRANPVVWNTPTSILYGENDNLTTYKTISDFSVRTGSELTVMKGGEHWFHTDEQMKFVDMWIKNRI